MTRREMLGMASVAVVAVAIGGGVLLSNGEGEEEDFGRDTDLLRVATQVKERFRREVQQSIEQLVDLQRVGPMTPRSGIALRTNHLMGVSRAGRTSTVDSTVSRRVPWPPRP